MIKVGILEASTAIGAELVRILLHHPDVILEWVHSSVVQGELAAAIRGVAGETGLHFSRHNLGAVDVIINCGSTPVGTEILSETACDPSVVKIIETSADNLPDTYVYGLCELNRKALVRGAMATVNATPLAMAVELALLPLAKHLMLNSPIGVSAVTGVGGLNYIVRRSGGNVPECEEIAEALRLAQSSFYQPVDIVEMRVGNVKGLMAVVSVKCLMPIGELKTMYEAVYSDHNFTFVSNEAVDTRDVAGTNKCMLHLEKSGELLRVTSVLDPSVKGAAGNAVHILNLMFGLHERTGLNLIAAGN